MKAVVNGDRIECGKCGGLLDKIIKVDLPEGEAAVLKSTIPPGGECTGYFLNKGIVLETKCTNRIKKDGKNKTCNTINQIEL